MGFTFRFDTLLKVRKIRENIAQQAFSKAQRHYYNLEHMKNLRLTAKQDMIRELTKRMKSGLTASQMKQYHDYIGFLDDSIKKLDKNLAAAQKQLDEKRIEMLNAKKEYQAIERLKEIDMEHYTSEQKRSEMRFIDEIAILRHGGSR